MNENGFPSGKWHAIKTINRCNLNVIPLVKLHWQEPQGKIQKKLKNNNGNAIKIKVQDIDSFGPQDFYSSSAATFTNVKTKVSRIYITNREQNCDKFAVVNAANNVQHSQIHIQATVDRCKCVCVLINK